MKPIKIIFFLILISSFSFSVKGQIPGKAFSLTNSLHSLWKKGKTKKAIKKSKELYHLYPPFFITRLHDTLAQQIARDTEDYGYEYLKQFQEDTNDPQINKIIAPIFLWSKTRQEPETSVDELRHLLKEEQPYESKAERYALLTVKELLEKKAIDKRQAGDLVMTVINRLEDSLEKTESMKNRAWYRYLLAYSYDFLYSNMEEKEEYLRLAAKYSPDLNDKVMLNEYFYDASLLTGNPRQIPYKTNYLEYLKAENRREEAFAALSDIAFLDPSEDNLTLLRGEYGELESTKPFSVYWEDFIHNKGIPAPKETFVFKNDTLDLSKNPDSWIFIDIWGTWCAPCIKEMPLLQSFYEENLKIDNTSLKIYTLSYGSRNLESFMVSKKYTFPVVEIGRDISESFNVTGYPTKILISPKGNYIQIPYGDHWLSYLKNLTLWKP